MRALKTDMKIQKIQEGVFVGKNVLLRADFNVAIVDGHPKERFKLEACRKSLDYLLSHGAKVALISHLGRPEGKDSKLSLEQLVPELSKIYNKKITFVPDCIGESVKSSLDQLEEGALLLLENVRFHEGEEKNDTAFAQALAENFDAFVNDAFSVCHRDQASVTGVAKLVPSYAGWWLQKELENLNKALHEPERPATAIIGGAKIETKLPLIRILEKSYDRVLVGGRVAVEAAEQKIKFSPHVIVAMDFAENNYDIGEKTIKRFKEVIAQSKMIVWNGPMGKFEESPYDKGTREVLDAIIECDAFSLIGGGESVQVLEERNLMDKVSFVSTGGGAMLEYMSGNDLPGIEVLKVS